MWREDKPALKAPQTRHPTAAQWTDWRWQLENAAHRIEDLIPDLTTGMDPQKMAEAHRRFPLAATPYYLNLIDRADLGDPLLRMTLPDPRELRHTPVLLQDPIDEEKHSPVPGLIRRYPDRAVLLVSSRCAVHCRHCTRRQMGTGSVRPLGNENLERAFDYIAKNREIRDVILSGGDPLLLEDDAIETLLRRLREIDTVEIVRIGSRVPVTLPMRVTAALARMIAKFGPIYLNTQFNHPREITVEAKEAIRLLVDAGIPVANQAVLLAGINDSKIIIEELCRALFRIRVRPYYLFLCDLWDGLEHFRTPLDTGIEIIAHLRGRLSGLAIPELIADLPGGLGKVPLVPNYIEKRSGRFTHLRSPGGQTAVYPDPLEVKDQTE